MEHRRAMVTVTCVRKCSKRMQRRLQKGLGLYYDGYATNILAFPQQFTRLNDRGKTILMGNRG